MAKVSVIKKAQKSKSTRRCVNCGQEVQVGESYKYANMKTGPRSSLTRIWCFRCHPKQSQLTLNDRLSRLYAVEEILAEALESYNKKAIDLDELKAEFESQADEVEAISGEYEESADNMPENLQYSSQAEELREKASSVEEWAERLRNVEWGDEDETCAECGEDEDAALHNEDNEAEYDHDFELKEPDVSDAESAISELSI